MADAPEILKDEKLRDSYPKLNAAIRNSNEALSTANTAKSTADTAKSTADTALANSESTQNQLDAVVIDGDSSPQIAQALADTPYTTLKQKHDAVDAQLAETERQLKTHDVKFTSHRGLNKAYPENTLLAFEMACLAGYKVIELDIQPTSDNVLVVHHDTTVDRMTTGTGNVTSFTLVGIKSLNIDGGAGASEYPALKVPTLEETLVLLRKYNVMPMIEFKVINDFAQLDTLVAVLKKYGFEYNSAIISSVTYLIDEFRKRGGKSEGLLLNTITTENTALLKTYGNCGYCSDYTVVTQSVIDSLHAEELSIAVYTVNDTATARQLRKWGADYITTDTIRGVS